MRAARFSLVTAFLGSGLCACSFLVPVEGLSGGADQDGAAAESGATTDASGPGVDASDATPDANGDAAVLPGAPAIGLGDGHDGSLHVTSAATVINDYLLLAADVAPGDTQLELASGAPPAGSVVLLWQAAGLSPLPGPSQTVDLASAGVGHYELARITVSQGATARLDRALAAHYGVAGAQLVVVPEYTSVTIDAIASLVPKPWDGAKGGIVAFLATDAVRNDGAIRADFAGFRGGVGVAANVSNCPSTGNGTIGAGFAAKGEGLGAPVAAGGLAAAANGGGGGNCSEAGGGGGAHAGAGGKGGKASSGQDNGGMGGEPLRYSLVDHLSLGGGGGAGQIDVLQRPNRGGNGGGVVFVRARSFSGGTISARGEDAVIDVDNGGSGGAAGGAIIVRAVDALSCVSANASGGAGSTAYDANSSPVGGAGPGGGGGGGQLLLQGATVACPSMVAGGSAGHQGVRGATDGAPGLVESLPGGL